MAWESFNDIYVPNTGGSIEGDLEVSGNLTVNDGSGNGATYDVASEITDLKDAWDSVSQELEDTGWRRLYYVADQIDISYRKKNGFVTVNGTSYDYYDIGGSQFHAIATMPSGCRPSRKIEFTMHFQGAGALNHSCYIGSDGAIKAWCASSKCTYWAFSVTFPVD